LRRTDIADQDLSRGQTDARVEGRHIAGRQVEMFEGTLCVKRRFARLGGVIADTMRGIEEG
jgi:hypothetical protein